jgi:membrane fusion protein, multidrug efflux system
MRKLLRWIIIISVVAVLVAVKLIFFTKKEEAPGAGKARGQGPVAVNYHVVRPANLSNDVFATGIVGAFNQVELVPEVNGKVISINFNEGEQVEKGRLLVKLNDQDLQAQLSKIRAQLRMSGLKLERFRKLVQINGVSREELEMQENEIATLEADESFVLAQLAKTSITAPFSGVAGLRNVSPGSFVNASTPVASLVQLKPLYVEFSVPEKYASIYKKGLPVSFTTENADGAKTFTASIYAVEPKVEAGTRSIKARAQYNGAATLYPGSFVKVLVNLGQVKDALMVPAQCVIPTLKGQKVFKVNGDSAIDNPVQMGVRDEKRVQVTNGVKAGDTIVASGLLAVKNGSKLKLLKPVD